MPVDKPSSSTEKQNAEADELSELLDSSLKDFNKTTKPKTTDDELDELMVAHDQQAAQKAASDFQTMLSQMVKIQEEAMQRDANAPAEGLDMNDPESQEMMNMMKQLMECSSKVANADSPDEFMAGLDMLRSADSPMEPFMAMMMQTLASKEFMYPPLKEIYDNFPKYFEENGASLDQETRSRYDKQFEVLGRICQEFEAQADALPDAVPPEEAALQVPPADGSHQITLEEEQRLETFERLGKMLVELQSHGYPPKELVGNLPDGWGIDESTGMPKVENQEAAVSACSIQ